MMREMRSRGAAALLTATALTAVAVASAPAAAAQRQGTVTVALRRCAPRKRSDPTRCGRVTVPLDRSGELPGTVGLRVRVVPPRSGRANGTIVALAGGPGQAATPLAPMIAEALGPLGRTRRIVTFDQRGTGRSGRLSCRGLARARTRRQVADAVARCAEQLGSRRAAYTTAASVDDIEAVRAALGADRIALFAVSYGTKVAADYAARYPQHVSRLVLDSVVPPAGVDPFMRTTFGSMPRVLRTVCAHGACAFTRDPAADLTALAHRLRRGPMRGAWYDGHGRRREVAVTAERLFSLLLAGDFDPIVRAALPAALHTAAAGDPASLLRLLVGSGGGGLDDSQDSDALYLATTCEDGGVPWPTGTPVPQRAAAFAQELAAVPEAQLEPFGRRLMGGLGIDLCRTWPESPIEQPSSPLPDVPTLILSGDEDLRTPRKDAQTLAAQLPHAQLVTVPETGHSALTSASSTCVLHAVTRFFSGARQRGCRFVAPRAIPARAPPPRSFAELAPTAGLHGRTGRTVTAVERTMDELAGELTVAVYRLLTSGDFDRARTVRFGGLHGGSVVLGDDGLTLRRYTVVPGVAVSGVMSMDDHAREWLVLHVGGRAAAHGTLRYGRSVTGRLDGRSVRVRMPHGSWVRSSGATLWTPQLTSAAAVRARLREALELAHRTPVALPEPPAPAGAIAGR
jgi:pimeloyl-ACP methyl ester carboxylesterase